MCNNSENTSWAEFWLEEYNSFRGIAPNEYVCGRCHYYPGMNAGESADYAWEQYQAYKEEGY